MKQCVWLNKPQERKGMWIPAERVLEFVILSAFITVIIGFIYLIG